jgi:cell division protein FtsB
MEVQDLHMARALLGHVGTVNEQNLLFEVTRLRRRITELEAELAQLRAEQHAEIDLELHRIADLVAATEVTV